MNWVFKKEGFLDWMFGRWRGGFDDHDRDHNREHDGFHGMLGRSDLFDDFSLLMAFLYGLLKLFQYHLTL
jgi:hypothetical protein